VLAPQAGLVAATVVALSVAFGDARSAFAGCVPSPGTVCSTVCMASCFRLPRHAVGACLGLALTTCVHQCLYQTVLFVTDLP